MDDPRVAAAATLKWAEAEATAIMEEYSTQSPYALAQELGLKRDVFDEGAEAALAVTDVLRGRQSDWLKGKRWPSRSEVIPGAPELTRTAEHAQVGPIAEVCAAERKKAPAPTRRPVPGQFIRTSHQSDVGRLSIRPPPETAKGA